MVSLGQKIKLLKTCEKRLCTYIDSCAMEKTLRENSLYVVVLIRCSSLFKRILKFDRFYDKSTETEKIGYTKVAAIYLNLKS